MARHLAQAGCRSYEFTVYMPTSAGCNRPASGCGHRALCLCCFVSYEIDLGTSARQNDLPHFSRGLILLEAQALGACTPERLGAFLPPGDGATRSE